jgi:hypothetical protein
MRPNYRQEYDGREDYEPFNPVDREVKRLHIRPLSNTWFHVTNSYLQYIAEDAGRGRVFNLTFGFLVVEVRGYCLQPVIHAIARDCCEFIQQFDPAKWEMPQRGKPFIESIKCWHPKDARIGTGGERKEKRQPEEA